MCNVSHGYQLAVWYWKFVCPFFLLPFGLRFNVYMWTIAVLPTSNIDSLVIYSLLPLYMVYPITAELVTCVAISRWCKHCRTGTFPFGRMFLYELGPVWYTLSWRWTYGMQLGPQLWRHAHWHKPAQQVHRHCDRLTLSRSEQPLSIKQSLQGATAIL